MRVRRIVECESAHYEVRAGSATCRLPGRDNVRVLVDEACAVVDLVVDDNVEVLLGGVLRDIRVGEFLSLRHCAVVWGG